MLKVYTLFPAKLISLPVMKDDINLFDYNVRDRVNHFVAAAVSQVNISSCDQRSIYQVTSEDTYLLWKYCY